MVTRTLALFERAMLLHQRCRDRACGGASPGVVRVIQFIHMDKNAKCLQFNHSGAPHAMCTTDSSPASKTKSFPPLSARLLLLLFAIKCVDVLMC